MFGADTPLVMDALQIAVLAGAACAGAVWYQLRRRKPEDAPPKAEAGALEDRVRVLERIATDRSHDLAEEIESLRERGEQKNKTEGAA